MSIADKIPFALRAWLKERFHGSLLQDPVRLFKYLPSRTACNSYALSVPQSPKLGTDGLPIPPRELQLMYGVDDAAYVQGGLVHYEALMRAVGDTGFSLSPGDRVIDFGCGAGRVLRQFRSAAENCEIWGVDISGDSINWCKSHLCPPFRFLTNTTIPHLPFEDRSVQLIYAASVFTHIEDLAEAWLMELRRILAPNGRLFITLLDEDSLALLETTAAESRLAQLMRGYPVFRNRGSDFGQLVIGRDRRSAVFYRRDFFFKHVAPTWRVLSIVPKCHDYQTGIVLGH